MRWSLLQVYVKSSELPTSMTAIRLQRQQYVRKYLDEGELLHIVLSVFAKFLRDKINIIQSCLDDDDYPLTRYTGAIRHKYCPQAFRTERSHISANCCCVGWGEAKMEKSK